MSKKFVRLAQNAFADMQMDAGLLLNKFDPTGETEVQDADIITATTGGITASCVPSYEDWGSDVDNCPENTLELKRINGHECKLSFTALSANATMVRLSLGAADIIGEGETTITPRSELKDTDFADIWWVGDKVGGGMIAICLKNALSTSGFSLKTTKNGKGNLSVELTGHVSIANIDEVPMEFYISDGE